MGEYYRFQFKRFPYHSKKEGRKMGIFKYNQRSGPGIYKDTPRKKGLLRYIEVLDQDFGKLFRSNLMCTLLSIPYFLLMFLFFQDGSFLFGLTAILVGGALAGPALCCMIDTCLRGLRDEGNMWGLAWKKAWKQNAREAVGPGIVGAFFLTVQLLAFEMFTSDIADGTLPAWFVLIISILFVSTILQYYFFQTCTMSLSAGTKLKNSIILFFQWLPRSLGAGAINTVCLLVLYAFLPYTLFFIVLIGFSLPLTASSLMLYAPFEKKFDLEAKIQDLHDKEEDIF